MPIPTKYLLSQVTLVQPKVKLRNTLLNIDNIKVVGKYIWKDAT